MVRGLMIFAFDDFELDAGRVELRRGGAQVALEPQVFALLRLLIERRDRVLSKDDIFDAIWKGRIVSDTALSSRIKSVRQALGDDGESQRYIRTIRGHGFRFVAEVRHQPAPAAALAEVMARPMIAVFPVRDETGLPVEGYFADGLADQLIAALSAWRWFPVLSRNATCAGGGGTALQRAAALGARYAVTGSLLRTDGSARLTVELCDVASGEQLWSAVVKRDLAELLAVQEEVAAEILRRLTPELASAERRRVIRKPHADMTAWDLTLKALWELRRPEHDRLATALEHLEAAVRLDPGAALPWSVTALARFESGLQGWIAGDAGSARRRFELMLGAARQAVELDPNGWMGHALASAGELWAAGSYPAARVHADTALSLNPSAGLAHHLSGCVFGFGGDPAEAIRVQTSVYRVDPDYRHSGIIEADLGLWTLLTGELDAARAHLERALALNPRERARPPAARRRAGGAAGETPLRRGPIASGWRRAAAPSARIT